MQTPPITTPRSPRNTLVAAEERHILEFEYPREHGAYRSCAPFELKVSTNRTKDLATRNMTTPTDSTPTTTTTSITPITTTTPIPTNPHFVILEHPLRLPRRSWERDYITVERVLQLHDQGFEHEMRLHHHQNHMEQMVSQLSANHLELHQARDLIEDAM
ncbi:hypothetical protein L1987_18646 [Smallanthus sonchifolius]|uniref:Uncharacterized protein n=1 Tax=Smallanthus sonchifolius TaxID=185202 RepID=A0ACB9J2D3_9ASTR|nr:hypothetical protein L1987_18646 [Smallanthus sonchifolius]